MPTEPTDWIRTEERLPKSDKPWVHCLVAIAGVSVETAIYKPDEDEWVNYPSGDPYMQPPEYWRPAPDAPRSVKSDNGRIPGRHPLQYVGKAMQDIQAAIDRFNNRYLN